MKKLSVILLPVFLLAQSFMISNIPLPRTYIQNLDPYECDEECLKEYLDKEMIFSFLAHADKKITNQALNDAKMINMAILNIGNIYANTTLRIAMLLPSKKIGKYASTTTNAAFAYLLSKNNSFTLKSFNILTEDAEEIQTTLQKIQAEGFSYVIAPLTKKGALNLITVDPDINIYIPTVNKNDFNVSSNYLTFGGIDYKAQSDILLQEAHSPLVIFSDKSSIGRELALYQEEQFLHPQPQIEENLTYEDEEPNLFQNIQEEQIDGDLNNTQRQVIKYFISRRTTNLEHYLKENEDIIEGSFFINTPIIKSGMIMSQLTLYDVNASNILSTQINYDPLLLSMTQYVDRKNMVVANSITKNSNPLIEINSLLDNDIVYDWINYTTTVGIDYFYNLITAQDREYDVALQNNQMVYDIELLQPSLSRFIPYHRVSQDTMQP